MINLLTTAKNTDDLYFGFDRDGRRRQRELTKNKNQNEKNHVRIYLKYSFSFAENQEKGTFVLGYKRTLTRNSDNAVINKDNAVNNAKIKIIAFEWYVPQYTPSVPQHTILMKQITNKTPTELQYEERSVFMKEVNKRIFGILNQELRKE